MPHILKYYLFFGVLSVGFGLTLWLHRGAHFSEVVIDEMVTRSSRERVLVEDPCLFRLTGDPTQPDRFQIRVNFFCSDGRIGWNTLAFTSLKDQTVGGAIGEVARIHGFVPERVVGWRCDISGRVSDWETVIYQGNWIECHEV